MTIQSNGKKQTGAKRISNDEFMAAAIGDVQWLKQSLKERQGEVSFDKNGLAPIHLAAIHGRLECIRLLIENYDVDVNLASSTGWRPIHLCVSAHTGNRAEACLTYVLEKGADPSITNEDGVTPVHQAASEGHVRCLKLLIDLGAQIDLKDCRGHLPIDLAKLWGHKSCARILATEMWHRDKDQVAREMRQLKKSRMREVLDQLEHAEELAEEERFYGKTAFEDWLQGVKEKSQVKEKAKKVIPVQAAKRAPSGKAKQEETRPLKLRRPVQPQPQLARANAAQPMRLKTQALDPHRVLVASRDHVTSPRPPAIREATPEGDVSRQDTARIRPIEQPPFWNDSEWNKSNHVDSETFGPYQPRLLDAYPRDPYSCQPHPRHSAPASLNVNSREPLAVLEGETDKALLQSLADRNRTLRGRHGKFDPVSMARPGPVVFKCRTILDAQSKRKWDRDSLPKAETVLHLSDDANSSLFQAALQPATAPATVRSAISPALSSVSQWEQRPLPKSGVNHLFMSLSRRTHFPAVKGREYDLNLGDLGGAV